MKRNKTNWNKKASISYLQIIILVTSIISFSYLIYSVDSVNAQGIENYACCEKTSGGNTCQFVPNKQCAPGSQTAPTECEETSFCKKGCCVNSIGMCMENSPQTICGGSWKEDASCNIPECEKGCCVCGDEAIWTTEKNCEKETSFLGLPVDFREDVNSEVECIFLTEKDEEGACVYKGDEDEKVCKFTTGEKCKLIGGYFYKNILCSDAGLETGCLPHNNTACITGKDEVYWLDSCGNKEEAKESCNIFMGTICGRYRPGIDKAPDTGDYTCRSLDCKVKIYGEETIKKNGESWCEYEGSVGEGRDTVGSRHVRHICFMGEERIEACDDYRNQICVQEDTALADGKIFSEGQCRVNRWRSCYEYNNREQTKMAEECEKNPDCFIKKVDISGNFKFDICVPSYPPGFDLRSEDPSRNGKIECALASQKCTVVYVKRVSGWDCETNCECEKAGFAEKMNDFCTTLGDCGAYVNYLGDTNSEGYSVRGSPRLSKNFIDGYKTYAEDKPGQKANPGNFSFSQILGIPEGLGEVQLTPEGGIGNLLAAGMSGIGLMKVGAASSAAGATGGLFSNVVYISHSGVASTGMQAVANSWLDVNPVTAQPLGTLGFKEASGEVTKITVGKTGIPQFPKWAGDALAVAGAIMSTQSFLSAGFGMDATSSWIVSGVGVLAAHFLFNVGFKLLGYYGLALMAISMILGLGKTKTKTVAFNCYPWQAPAGGEKCDLCNPKSELDVPCSEYKCNSIGQACELINKRTEDEKCINNDPNDISSPRIKPLYNFISEGYEYANVGDDRFEIKNKNGNCVPEYEVLNFGIETTDSAGKPKPAQCKIGYDALQDYEDMEFFGDKNSYLTNHTLSMQAPSLAAFKNHYNLTDEQIRALGDINFYVKCKSINGIINTAPYAIKTCIEPGPDLTAPRVTKVSPETSYAKYNSTEKDLAIWTNEPADCRWSNEEQDYGLMKNEFNCKQGLEDYSLYGWPCNTTLTGINKNNTILYIKCSDQPWLEEKDRNAMTESYTYEVIVSESELAISSIEPENGKVVVSNVEPVSLELRLKTSGGAEAGKAECFYKSFGATDYTSFFKTSSSEHSQLFTQMIRGSYRINLKCQDSAGNTDENTTEFVVEVDRAAPKVTRVYHSNGLKVMTDEDSACAYSFIDDKCGFDIENATSMSGEGTEHSAAWQTDSTYFIKCQDKYGNQPGKCSFIARPYGISKNL